MKEEDDMLELLDEEDLGAASADEEELELDDDAADELTDEDLELDDADEESAGEQEPASGDEPGEEEPAGDEEAEDEEEDEEEPAGLVLDVRYIALAAIAIGAIILGAVFFLLPMMADNPPAVSFTPSQQGEDLYLTHTGTDPLFQEHLTVLINGAPLPAEKYSLMGGSPWPWVLNSVLRIDTSGYAKPAPVALIYRPKGTDHVIFGTTVEPTPTPTPVPTPEPVITPDLNVTNVTGPVAVTPITQIESGASATEPTPVPVQPITSDVISMSVSPVSGPAPLTVQCSDQTAGCIRNRVWNFGDGQTSMKRNPGHVFAYPGTYNVTLDVRFCDPDDNPTVLPLQPVVVEPILRHDTISGGTGDARILPGARFFFTVKGPGKVVRIGGRDHTLKSGDHVQLTLNSGGTGDISVVSNAILRCDYSNVTMTVNGDEIITGTISSINIDQYEDFEVADLTIQVIVGRDGTKGLVDGEPVINAAPGELLTLTGVGVDSSGKLLFSVQNGAGYSFRGGIGSHETGAFVPA